MKKRRAHRMTHVYVILGRRMDQADGLQVQDLRHTITFKLLGAVFIKESGQLFFQGFRGLAGCELNIGIREIIASPGIVGQQAATKPTGVHLDE